MLDKQIDKLFIFMEMEFKSGKIRVNHHDHGGDHNVELYQIDEQAFEKLREYLRKV